MFNLLYVLNRFSDAYNSMVAANLEENLKEEYKEQYSGEIIHSMYINICMYIYVCSVACLYVRVCMWMDLITLSHKQII